MGRGWGAAVGAALIVALGTPLAAQNPAPEVDGPPVWIPFGDLRLRGERVDLIDGTTLERSRVSLRPGLLWSANESIELGAALRLAAGTDPARVANDNEEKDGVRLDQAFLRWFATAGSELSVGKIEMPLWLTPMVWDRDLRPVGVAWISDLPIRDFDAFRWVAGVFAGDHRFDDDSRIWALQGAWSIREGAARGGEVILSLLRFEDLDELVASGLMRTNRSENGRPVSDFELVDLQLGGRIPLAGGSLAGALDTAINLGADDEDRATRASLLWEHAGDPGRFLAGAAAQRIERDAVPAAFNSDDWWFHSATRGVSAWVGYRPSRSLELTVGFFSERLDGQNARTERLLVELRFAP